MVEHSKRKKFHDKDKYYRLAKEQGLRSRAAFKLTQINRKFPVLEKCIHGVLDLCAAPGGWTQIAARTCSKQIPIVAVDILPIRAMPGHPNVRTLIGDITTDACKAEIQRTLNGSLVDVVLHDGAPNVGADYSKDAYEQNELALHALRCATQHLMPSGTFITKIYRSQDYAKFNWLLQQFFGDVSALKPQASRSQSAEIFLVCSEYKAPAKIDPRMLDPRHVFESVQGETTGGVLGGSAGAISIFHKNHDKQTRKRGGYDMEHLDATMRHIESITNFVQSKSLKESIQILSHSTGLSFTCEECQEDKDIATCHCSFFLHHPLTTPEIKECVSDLQVLNKSDFKGILHWRVKMQEAMKARVERDDNGVDSDRSSSADTYASEGEGEISDQEDEEEIQAEIAAMRARRLREKKREKKKERELAAKRRKRAALGMDLNAIDVPEHDKIFSLASITSKGALEAAAEVNLDRVTDDQIFGDSDDDIVIGKDPDEENSEQSDSEAALRRRERDLDRAYQQYLEKTKDGLAKSGTKMAKRSKKVQRQKLLHEAVEDQEMALAAPENIEYDARAYAKLLQGPEHSDHDSDSDSENEEDDDGYDADPMTPEEYAALQVAKKKKDQNPLIHKFPEESASVKTARWFSNPLFANIGKVADAASTTKKSEVQASYNDDSSGDESSDSDDSSSSPKNRNKGLDAEQVLALMPKTDKQVRHERRLKQMAREEKKKERRARKLETEGEFEVAPEDEEEDVNLKDMSESQKKKVLEARELIKAGMGSALLDDKDNGRGGIEIVSPDDDNRLAGKKRPLLVMDDRKYDSDHEQYDSDDYATTLALGTMILRRSKEKALVDASYNRFAWNDPDDLPEWFVDDERKHYRPQLPIPPALLAKMKEKMMALSTKPIKKVAEARARKNKRAKLKLAAAKKKAEAVANSTDMSEAMKLKAISKALRGQESQTKKPGKTYVVAKKGRGNVGAKGVKMVDKRLKADKRAQQRLEKTKKKGKQNKLVGAKRRRHHG